MEAPEVPLEQTQEDLHHKAHSSGNRWMMMVAMSSAILATIAAVGSLMAGHYSNEAMIEQLKASDQWNYYQAKGVKANVLASKMDIMVALGKPADPKDKEKLGEYKKEQEEIKKEAEVLEHEAQHHLHKHVILARSVTMEQVAISISAIAVLTSRRRFWFLAMGFGAAGILFLAQGLWG